MWHCNTVNELRKITKRMKGVLPLGLADKRIGGRWPKSKNIGRPGTTIDQMIDVEWTCMMEQYVPETTAEFNYVNYRSELPNNPYRYRTLFQYLVAIKIGLICFESRHTHSFMSFCVFVQMKYPGTEISWHRIDTDFVFSL